MSLRPFKVKLLVLAFGLALAVGFALFGPEQQECVSASSCGTGSSYCASGCCLGSTVQDRVKSCVRHSQGWCDWVWEYINPVYCNAQCANYFNARKCSKPEGAAWPCSIQDNYRWIYCCGAAPAPTNTPVPPPPPTNTPVPPPPPTNTPVPPPPPTNTPVPPTATPTRTPTATPTVVPLVVSLTPQHGSLVLYGPKLGLPAQTLNGTISGGTLPYTVTLTVQRPDNTTASYNLSPAGNFSLTPANAGDTYFGTTMLGTWRAWFTVTDSGARSATSNTVTWKVVWYPVHGVP